MTELDNARLRAIETSIRVLRKKDRWRLRKRNRKAVKALEAARCRLLAIRMAEEIEAPE